MLDELEKVKADERSLVLVASGYLELLVEILVEARCKHGKQITNDSRSYPYSAKLLILHEIGALDDRLFKHLERFRKLRNRAAHEPFFEITDQDRAGFVEGKDGSRTLGYHCFSLVAVFWNSNAPVLSPRFLPHPKKA